MFTLCKIATITENYQFPPLPPPHKKNKIRFFKQRNISLTLASIVWRPICLSLHIKAWLCGTLIESWLTITIIITNLPYITIPGSVFYQYLVTNRRHRQRVVIRWQFLNPTVSEFKPYNHPDILTYQEHCENNPKIKETLMQKECWS